MDDLRSAEICTIGFQKFKVRTHLEKRLAERDKSLVITINHNGLAAISLSW